MLEEWIETDLAASAVYCALQSLPGKVLLDDSSRGEGRRFSLIGVDPRASISLRGRRLLLHRRGGGLEIGSDFLAAARILWQEVRGLAEPRPDWGRFSGGLMGFWGYELGTHFEDVPARNPRDSSLPDAWLGAFDCWLEVDESRPCPLRVVSLVDDEEARERVRRVRSLIAGGQHLDQAPLAQGPRVALSNMRRSDYLDCVRKIHESIRRGDVYQVNLTQRFLMALPLNPIQVFERVRREHPAPFAGLWEWRGQALSSHSPESFLRLDGDRVISKPIKGTIARGANPVEDEQLKDVLQASAKDQAELAMIVDLIRNDLSRVCRPRSVRVVDHAHIESAPTVHHLVTDVHGRLRKDADFFDLIRATWPGGSITGAPKISAMKVIDRLETVRRGPYTGSLGYYSTNGCGEWNIAIRSLILEGGFARIHGGGGITIDSDPESEYRESLVKVAGILKALDGKVAEPWPSS